MEDCGGGVFYCAGEKVEIMDNAIDFSDCGLGEVVVHKLNGVKKRSYLVTESGQHSSTTAASM